MKNTNAMRKINKIIIHCSATPEGREVSVREIDSWHRQQGYNGIGYHYLIGLDGSVNAGRPEANIGAHCRGHNKDSIGVCYVGGCDAKMKPKDTRTPQQRTALRRLAAELQGRYPGATLHGHNEFAAKACPSFDVGKDW